MTKPEKPDVAISEIQAREFAASLLKSVQALSSIHMSVDNSREFHAFVNDKFSRGRVADLSSDALLRLMPDRPNVDALVAWLNGQNEPGFKTQFDRPKRPYSQMETRHVRMAVERSKNKAQEFDLKEAELLAKVAELETQAAALRLEAVGVRKDKEDYTAYARMTTYHAMLQYLHRFCADARDFGPLLVIYQAVLRQNPDNAERLMTTLRVMATDEEFLTDVANIVMKICLLYDRKTELKLREIAALNKARAAAMEAGGPKAAAKIPNPDFDLNAVAAEIAAITNPRSDKASTTTSTASADPHATSIASVTTEPPAVSDDPGDAASEAADLGDDDDDDDVYGLRGLADGDHVTDQDVDDFDGLNDVEEDTSSVLTEEEKREIAKLYGVTFGPDGKPFRRAMIKKDNSSDD